MSLPLWIKYLGAAVVAAAGAWFANRIIAKAAWQQAINTGFEKLVSALQAERAALVADFAKERQDLIRRFEELEAEYEAAKKQSHEERMALRGEIRQLTQVILSLENVLRANGVPVPERPRELGIMYVLTDGTSDATLFQGDKDDDDQG